MRCRLVLSCVRVPRAQAYHAVDEFAMLSEIAEGAKASAGVVAAADRLCWCCGGSVQIVARIIATLDEQMTHTSTGTPAKSQ